MKTIKNLLAVMLLAFATSAGAVPTYDNIVSWPTETSGNWAFNVKIGTVSGTYVDSKYFIYDETTVGLDLPDGWAHYFFVVEAWIQTPFGPDPWELRYTTAEREIVALGTNRWCAFCEDPPRQRFILAPDNGGINDCETRLVSNAPHNWYDGMLVERKLPGGLWHRYMEFWSYQSGPNQDEVWFTTPATEFNFLIEEEYQTLSCAMEPLAYWTPTIP